MRKMLGALAVLVLAGPVLSECPSTEDVIEAISKKGKATTQFIRIGGQEWQVWRAPPASKLEGVAFEPGREKKKGSQHTCTYQTAAAGLKGIIIHRNK